VRRRCRVGASGNDPVEEIASGGSVLLTSAAEAKAGGASAAAAGNAAGRPASINCPVMLHHGPS
jgi:hypothetical protein